ncbi:MAG: GNAT family N-acetyltransferase [Bryobacteraceae bacterium]|nr:GNAT family N-acetyltransferase [Bryobacteraceae bacterium]
MYLLVDAAASSTVRAAELEGGHLADIRITLARPAEPGTAQPVEIRVATGEDVSALKRIAAVSHTDSRFYHDPGFPRELCDNLYETWIERSVTSDFAQIVFVAEVRSKAAGYISCHVDSRGARIGLLAVDKKARGQGIARGLVQHALSYFASHSCSQIEVVTQGRNLDAQRLYLKAGFIPKSVELWYHKWFGLEDRSS